MTRFRRAAFCCVIGAMFGLLGVDPAFAHDSGESDKAGDLVRQAIAYIVNEPDNPMAAAEKVNDAGKAGHKEGVDMGLVAQSAEALDKGDIHQARALLERSIGARSHLDDSDPLPIGQVSPLAVGAETGINVVSDPLAPHRRVTGGDWLALAALGVLGAVGVSLSWRFRPHAVGEPT